MPRFTRPTTATLAAACIASFALVGGTATAAKLITSKDIKNGTIKAADLSSGAKRALKGKAGPRGATGPSGPQGAHGAQGPAGRNGVPSTRVVEASMTIAPGDVSGPQAFCPAGMVVVGTGYFVGIGHPGFVQAFGGTSVGLGVINDTSIPLDVDVQAICAPGSTSAGLARAASRAGDAFGRRLAQLEMANR